ncbi:MAG: zinc-ribbon domain-containing protein [archaeon]
MSEKKSSEQQRVVLPRAEWKAFTDDVRKLIHADEELLNAYHRLLKAYDQLSEAYSQLPEGEMQGKRSLGGRSLFGRRQTPTSLRPCPYCGSGVEPEAKSCPACGRRINPSLQQQATFPNSSLS